MNLLYATTGSTNTAALIFTEGEQKLRREKLQGFGMRILGVFCRYVVALDDSVCARGMCPAASPSKPSQKKSNI